MHQPEQRDLSRYGYFRLLLHIRLALRRLVDGDVHDSFDDRLDHKQFQRHPHQLDSRQFRLAYDRVEVFLQAVATEPGEAAVSPGEVDGLAGAGVQAGNATVRPGGRQGR